MRAIINHDWAKPEGGGAPETPTLRELVQDMLLGVGAVFAVAAIASARSSVRAQAPT
jgi:hypothetical protein